MTASIFTQKQTLFLGAPHSPLHANHPDIHTKVGPPRQPWPGAHDLLLQGP